MRHNPFKLPSTRKITGKRRNVGKRIFHSVGWFVTKANAKRYCKINKQYRRIKGCMVIKQKPTWKSKYRYIYVVYTR